MIMIMEITYIFSTFTTFSTKTERGAVRIDIEILLNDRRTPPSQITHPGRFNQRQKARILKPGKSSVERGFVSSPIKRRQRVRDLHWTLTPSRRSMQPLSRRRTGHRPPNVGVDLRFYCSIVPFSDSCAFTPSAPADNQKDDSGRCSLPRSIYREER